MKIRLGDRLILLGGATLAILSGICMVLVGLQALGIHVDLTGLRVFCFIAGIFTIFFGFYLFTFPMKFDENRQGFVVQHSKNGDIRISVKAIENQVRKCLEKHEEVTLLSMNVGNLRRNGVRVLLNISLPSNISIPMAADSLQKQVKQYLQASSGVEVNEVRVSVETTLPISEEAAENSEETATPAEQTENDPPIHQRIFNRADQMATVPQPPAAETTASDKERL